MIRATTITIRTTTTTTEKSGISKIFEISQIVKMPDRDGWDILAS